MFAHYAKWLSDFFFNVQPLVQSKMKSSFFLFTAAINSFETLKEDLASACLTSVK